MAGTSREEITYFYNGFTYKITETNDVHHRLEDEMQFISYLKENSNAIEISTQENNSFDQVSSHHIMEEDIDKGNEDQKVFTWNTNSTKLLIAEYSKRIDRFWDPKIKKKGLWGEIKHVFDKHCYDVTPLLLDMKFRNLKHHYKTIKDNNKKSRTGRGRICWEFFEEMDSLFENDRTINQGKILTTMPEARQQCTEASEIATGPAEESYFEDTPDKLEITSISGQKRSHLGETPTSSKRQKNRESRGLYRLRQEYMAIERQRVDSLTNLVQELKNHNSLQAERNNLLKQYLETRDK